MLDRFKIQSPPAGTNKMTVKDVPRTRPLTGPSTHAPRRPSVLVVDDDANITRIFGTCLDRAGFGVVIAPSLGVAQELISEAERVFDVALIDLHLPDGDGDELIRALMQRDPLCMSLVVTGDATPSTQRRLAQTGAHASLLKPVMAQELLVAVKATYDSTRAWRELAAEPAPDFRCRMTDPVPKPRDGAPYPIDLRRAVQRVGEIGELSPIQTEIAEHMLLGLADREIAAALKMRVRTVKYHVSQVIQRTGASGRSGLLAVLLADAD